jgi:Fic family protein
MDPLAFKEGAPGNLVSLDELGSGAFAFVPEPLPVRGLALSPEVLLALSSADAQLGKLDGVATNLPDPELLIGPFLRREAVTSSRIEGTQTSFSDLVMLEAAEELGDSGDAREVSDYADALRYGVRRMDEIGIGRQLMFEVHQLLMAHTDRIRTKPGMLRTRQVFIGPRNEPIRNARFVPPPTLAVPDAVENLFEYYRNPDKLPLLVRLGILHYQFETIHPFLDGNGRMGRLLIVLMLCHQRRLTAPMLYLSAYFERHRTRYYDLLLGVSQRGEWEPWIIFFLEAIAEQANDAIVRTLELSQMRKTYRERLSGARRSASALQLIDELFRFPVLTTRIARRVLKVSDTAALDNIQKLIDAGILAYSHSRGRRQVFVAAEIIDVIDRIIPTP